MATPMVMKHETSLGLPLFTMGLRFFFFIGWFKKTQCSEHANKSWLAAINLANVALTHYQSIKKIAS
jgi:hypothetical protein